MSHTYESFRHVPFIDSDVCAQPVLYRVNAIQYLDSVELYSPRVIHNCEYSMGTGIHELYMLASLQHSMHGHTYPCILAPIRDLRRYVFTVTPCTNTSEQYSFIDDFLERRNAAIKRREQTVTLYLVVPQ